MLTKTLAASALSISLLAAGTGSAVAVFPPLKSSNLERKELQLPRDFAGRLNLVLIAFERRQQRDIDTWLATLPAFQKAYPSLAWYELPTIARLNPLARWFIDNGMRSGIPDRAQHARTITLYIDKAPFKAALQLPSEDRIYALLLNQRGEVVWRAEGQYSEGKGKSLLEYLAGKE